VVDSGAAECADLDGALPLGARVLQLAEPLALGAGVDEQERGAPQELRIELLLAGSVGADRRYCGGG